VWANVWAVTDLDPELLKKANIRPFATVQEAVDAALAQNKDAQVLVSMDGSITVPRVD
jgi:hypothetical protein